MCDFFADPKDLTDHELEDVHAEIQRQLKNGWTNLGAVTPHSSQEKWAEDGIRELQMWRDDVEEEMERRRVDEVSSYADWVYEVEKDRKMERRER